MSFMLSIDCINTFLGMNALVATGASCSLHVRHAPHYSVQENDDKVTFSQVGIVQDESGDDTSFMPCIIVSSSRMGDFHAPLQ